MESKSLKIKVIWYCHKCGYKWKGVKFRKNMVEELEEPVEAYVPNVKVEW